MADFILSAAAKFFTYPRKVVLTGVGQNLGTLVLTQNPTTPSTVTLADASVHKITTQPAIEYQSLGGNLSSYIFIVDYSANFDADPTGDCEDNGGQGGLEHLVGASITITITNTPTGGSPSNQTLNNIPDTNPDADHVTPAFPVNP